MAETPWNAWFDSQLDRLAAGRPLETPPPTGEPPAGWADDLQAAARLAKLDLAGESRARANLRTRLAWMAMTRLPARSAVRRPPGQAAWLPGLAAGLLFVFLVLFNQPALAMVQRILGYGYLPQVGFFSMSGSLLLKGPVELQQNGAPILVRQGLALPGGQAGTGTTWLWLEGDCDAPDLADVWLEVLQPAQDRRLPAQSVQRTGSRQVRLAFAMLPPGATQAALHLPGGQHIPLEWVPAAEAGLAPTQVSAPTATRGPGGEATPAPCLNVTSRLALCVQAAYADEQGTRLLVEALPLERGLSMAWDAKTVGQIELRAENHTLSALETAAAESGARILRFAALPEGTSAVTLHLPGVLVRRDGQDEWIAGPFDLPLRLPDRAVRSSPTPAVIRTGERQPVPTPAAPNRP